MPQAKYFAHGFCRDKELRQDTSVANFSQFHNFCGPLSKEDSTASSWNNLDIHSLISGAWAGVFGSLGSAGTVPLECLCVTFPYGLGIPRAWQSQGSQTYYMALLIKTTRSSLLSAGKASNTPSLFCLKDRATLQSCVII